MVKTKLGWYDTLRYRLVPPFFLVFFTGSVQVLALAGRGEPVRLLDVFLNSLGNRFSWSAVAAFFAWAVFWLEVPSAKTLGPVSPHGYVPFYQDNGVLYYLSSLGAFGACHFVWPDLSGLVYENTPQILGSLNCLALCLCLLLYLKGRLSPDAPEERTDGLPGPYLFYRGIDLHPSFAGIDVKQLTNCRIGLMGWQILVVAYFAESVRVNGFATSTFVTFFIQTAYLYKFFVWEACYFHTLDMTMDRAGYYLCWGCLVWLPCLFGHASYSQVASLPRLLPAWLSLLCLGLGLGAVYLNYRVDREKRDFRRDPEGYVDVWGKKATYIHVPSRGSYLLTSGFWGLARHLNYTLDLSVTLFASLPSWGLGIRPFFCFYFLLILFLHRCYRDEDKCFRKYGPYWKEYCRRVPYRFIPYVF